MTPGNQETLSQTSITGPVVGHSAPLVLLTIASHPDARRVGEEAWLPALGLGQRVALSRMEPIFASPRGAGSGWPLADPGLSRQPAILETAPGGVRLRVTEGALRVRVDGSPFLGERVFDAEALALGVPLGLGRDVVLLLHEEPPPAARPPSMGLVGESAALQRLRAEVLRLADVPVSVLIRGETGTGKELVAAAIHRQSGRGHLPWEAVSMAALSPSTALSTLFGHVRGAFTGAVADQPGCFVAADKSTLFLDEIAEAPADVQTMLLRVLETGLVLPLGGRTARRVDVRILAATDAELELAVATGHFRAPLQHRLEGYRLFVPPLRARRADVGRLLYGFLRDELTRLGEAERLDAAPGRPAWLEGAFVEQALVHDWPGNVRQLRNVARQLAIASRGQHHARTDGVLPRALPGRIDAPAPPPSVEAARRPADITEAELLQSLAEHAWRIGPCARALGLPRSSLYMLIDRCAAIRKASDVPRAEIDAALAHCGGDLDQAAARLRVSPRGLQLRLNT